MQWKKEEDEEQGWYNTSSGRERNQCPGLNLLFYGALDVFELAFSHYLLQQRNLLPTSHLWPPYIIRDTWMEKVAGGGWPRNCKSSFRPSLKRDPSKTAAQGRRAGDEENVQFTFSVNLPWSPRRNINSDVNWDKRDIEATGGHATVARGGDKIFIPRPYDPPKCETNRWFRL